MAKLMTSAKTLTYIRAATIFGTALHLLVDASVTNEKIEHDLESFNVRDVHVSEIAPSLEDVFVRLTETRGRPIVCAVPWSCSRMNESFRRPLSGSFSS